MLTRTLCAEWAKHGVNVNGVAPGYYDTELTGALVQDAHRERVHGVIEQVLWASGRLQG